MAWASTSTVILGCLAFAVWWVFAVFPKVPLFPIGRTAGSLLGAALMVVFQVLSPDQAFASIDLPILALLFGTMVVSVYLRRADLFKYLGHALSWRTLGGIDLLCRLSLVAALSSALVTNDTTCVVLTGFVLELCREKNLRPKPFLLALACSANIGSAATPIGNPQNLVIAINSGIGFGRFLAGVLPAMVVGLVVNTLLLVMAFGRHLVQERSSSEDTAHVDTDSVISSKHISEGVYVQVRLDCISVSHNGDSSNRGGIPEPGSVLQSSSGIEMANCESSAGARTGNARDEIRRADSVGQSASGSIESGTTGLSLEVAVHRSSLNSERVSENLNTTVSPDDLAKGPMERILTLMCGRERAAKLWPMKPSWKKNLWKTSIFLVTLGMLAAFLAGLNLAWTALAAAVAMMVLDFSDAGPSLEKVSYALLVFFSGMFIATSGFDATGAPQQFWSAVEPHSQIDSAGGIIVLSLVVTVLSNVVSNVPTVILLGSRVAASAGANADKAWLILAWVSTVAGNLTLIGSAANIIVAEQARETQAERVRRLTGDSQLPRRATYNLTFWGHLKFGFIATLIVIAVGVVPIAIRKF